MNLLFDFTVDRETATIHITREFDADQDLVWDAFTQPELLEQWMAPPPMKIQTKEMDFRVGGRWQYAMTPPENVSRWSLAEYLEIDPKNSFTSRNSFCDEEGKPVNIGLSFSITKTSFTAGEKTTPVHISKKMGNLAELDQFIAMGFKEGMSAVLLTLENLLKQMAG